MNGSFTQLMGEILPQCIYLYNHHVVHFEYLIFLFVNYTSVEAFLGLLILVIQ